MLYSILVTALFCVQAAAADWNAGQDAALAAAKSRASAQAAASRRDSVIAQLRQQGFKRQSDGSLRRFVCADRASDHECMSYHSIDATPKASSLGLALVVNHYDAHDSHLYGEVPYATALEMVGFYGAEGVKTLSDYRARGAGERSYAIRRCEQNGGVWWEFYGICQGSSLSRGAGVGGPQASDY